MINVINILSCQLQADQWMSLSRDQMSVFGVTPTATATLLYSHNHNTAANKNHQLIDGLCLGTSATAFNENLAILLSHHMKYHVRRVGY